MKMNSYFNSKKAYCSKRTILCLKVNTNLIKRSMWSTLSRTCKKGYEYSTHRAKLLSSTGISNQERYITQAQLKEVEKLTNTRIGVANDPKRMEFGHYVLESTSNIPGHDVVATHSKNVDGQDTSFGSKIDLQGNTLDGSQMLAYKNAKIGFIRNLSASEQHSINTETYRRLCCIRHIREKNPREHFVLECYIKKTLEEGYRNNTLDKAMENIERIMDKVIKQNFYEFKEPL